jgi:hypothetical protein
VLELFELVAAGVRQADSFARHAARLSSRSMLLRSSPRPESAIAFVMD